MTTTLKAAETELSKQISDYWFSTTTSAGSATTLVDTALQANASDWLTDETWVLLEEEPTGNAAIYDERKITTFDSSTYTLTSLAFAAAPGTGIDYSLHRSFSPSNKRIALVAACRRVYPACFDRIIDESHVTSNWLKDGSLERWTTTTNLTDWTETTVTATQTSTSPYYKHGKYSAKLDTLAGRISQGITNFDDLKYLAGKNVTFSVQGWCDTASCLRIQVYDGTTTTTSSYHAGNSAWTTDSDPLEVSVDIGEKPTEITFRILHDVAAGVSYVDDARVIAGERGKVYIGDLSLFQNKPHQVFCEIGNYNHSEPWIPIRDSWVDEDGYLYLPTNIAPDRRMRIIGVALLDFLASGSSSTAWTATINLDQPQLDILIAEAALHLYTTMSMPNFESGTREAYQQMMAFWKQEAMERRAKFHMLSPSTMINWGVS